MSKNNDVFDKTKEIPGVKNGETENTSVHKDQSSLFDAGEIFSESMVVEKEDVNVDSSENAEDCAQTAVFSFPEQNKKDLTSKELQENAKDYFNATHSDNIEDKVNELLKLADENFNDDEQPFGEENTDIAEIFGTAETANKKKSRKEKKREKLEKKKKKKGYVSDDDINMLMGFDESSAPAAAEETEAYSDAAFSDTVENIDTVQKSDVKVGETLEDGSVEYNDPFGTQEDEEQIISAIGVGNKKFKTFEAVFENEELDDEYTDRDQESEILAKLRKKAIFSSISVIATIILCVICIYFEAVSGTSLPHPTFFNNTKYGVTFAMSMLQIMFIGILFNFGGVARAFKGLRPGKVLAEGYCAAVLVVCTLHSVLSCFVSKDGEDIVSYCSVGMICLVVLSINSFIKASSTLNAFCFAASKHPKYSTKKLSAGSLEEASFEKYLDSDTTVITAQKSDFVNGFFKKQAACPVAAKRTVKWIIAFTIVSLVVAVITGVLGGVYTGVCTFTVMSLAAFPVNALLSTALPFFIASNRAKKTQTAYIGEAACDAYDSTGVISFDDTEVFPVRSVRVSSIRTYGDNRIDKVILYMAKVFDKVGGPLSYVFANSIQTVDDFGIDAEITERTAGGFVTKIDGREVLVGTGEFLKQYNIDSPFDNIDESFVRSLGSIMYMAVDGEIAAKFYIKYTMSRSFEPMLRSFYDAGICVGIKTLDPCITTELVLSNLKGTNYPVSVINVYARGENMAQVSESTDSAIVSLSGVHNFLLGFIRLDNLRDVYRSNTYISIISAFVGIGISAFMCLSGVFGENVSAVSAIAIAIFQALWCLPTVLLSVFSNK